MNCRFSEIEKWRYPLTIRLIIQKDFRVIEDQKYFLVQVIVPHPEGILIVHGNSTTLIRRNSECDIQMEFL